MNELENFIKDLGVEIKNQVNIERNDRVWNVETAYLIFEKAKTYLKQNKDGDSKGS